MQPQPPKRGSGWKWGLGLAALIVVIAVTAVVTSAVVRKGDDDSSRTAAPPSSSGTPRSDIASANDTGPVTVITEDPSCAAATPILETRAAIQRNGWDKRDASVPASAWSPEVRAQYEAVGRSMRQSADQLSAVASLTPHRVMRELYEQVIAYSRIYADSVQDYTSRDDNAALVSTNASTAVSLICAAIDNGSAAARSSLIPEGPARPGSQAVGDPVNAQPFLSGMNAECGPWDAALSVFDNDTAEWRVIPAEIPASEWTPEQKAITDAVVPVMRRLASLQQLSGERSGNAVWRDLAELSSQYRLAYAAALPTYVPSDDVLAAVSLRVGSVVSAACRLVDD